MARPPVRGSASHAAWTAAHSPAGSSSSDTSVWGVCESARRLGSRRRAARRGAVRSASRASSTKRWSAPVVVMSATPPPRIELASQCARTRTPSERSSPVAEMGHMGGVLLSGSRLQL